MIDPRIQTLHRQHKKVAIFEASDLPRLSFGTDGVLGIMGEETISVEQERAFFLRACGHVITHASQLGQICQYCRAVAEAAGIPEPDFAATCCKECTRQCSVPTCKVFLCQSHALQHPADSLWYCPEHFVEFDEQVRKQLIVARWGYPAWLVAKFCRAMFSLNKKSLPTCTALTIRHFDNASKR